ncbi:hypothetical protein DSO57_1032960 [Entomophthora muscae]|uniref:Uncharacterized protein n=1 Tax=Entomophthora muscae TaxID=34485 RepID=A0ACC2TBE3_9FUNG|nr:hypothetical protein DSO57_1032960 [Entomophthora muscae]
MVKEVIKWSSKVKQLPSWGKPQNPAPSTAVFVKETQTLSSKAQGDVPKGLVPKQGESYQLSPKEKQHQTQMGLCMYCGKVGHSAKSYQALAKVQSPTTLLASSFNKKPSQSYALLPVKLGFSQSYALLPVKLGSSQSSQEGKALLDTGAMRNFISSAKELNVRVFWLPPTHPTSIHCPI